MKSLIVCLLAISVSISGIAQKARLNSDTTIKIYLTYRCEMHPEYVSNTQAKCPICHSTMSLSPKEQMKTEVVKLYTCPMHPNVLCTKAGKCPECNMNMVEFKPKSKS
jgi:hypothetical protein